MSANPLLTASTLPFELPPFEQIRPEHYREAFDRGMAEHRADIDAIVETAEPPTFENTLAALERSGALLSRASHIFHGIASAMATPEMQAVAEDYAAPLADHHDAIALDPRLYQRIRAVHDDEAAMGELDAESRYLVQRRLTEFTAAGAGLGEEAKSRLRDLNGQLATLTTKFEKQLLADSNDLAVLIDSREELDGLTQGEISATAAAAAEAGHEGKYLVTLGHPTGHPYLASLTDRALRRRIHEAQVSRGNRDNEHDTKALLLQIVRLRAERSALLGYPNHASAALADSTAESPDRVMDLLSRLAPAAARNARAEQAALEADAGHPIEAHDWAFHAERVRAAQFDVDLAALRPYFEAERVLVDGVFHAATRLYGITFHERDDLVGYHPDVRVFEVREADGSPIGLFLLDLYTRSTKKGGAWMTSPVQQASLLGHEHVIVTNNLNVPKPGAGEPTLLTYAETNTLFHEFGHALHGLLARVTYPHFSGTSVFRDFVEYPSQVNEMWMLWPEVLANYAVHHKTGEPLPQEVVDRLTAAGEFNQGFMTSEYLAASLLDQAWHALGVDEIPEDVAAFESAALEKVGLANPLVPPRYSSTYFAHAFAYGYDAQYYAYIWSEVLDADTVAWFRQNGGLTRENGDRYREYIVGIGGSADPLASYREFRGADADLDHLLTRRGLN